MSGEEYREMGYYPYILEDIVLDIGRDCQVFASTLASVNWLIERFNYFRSGDIGERAINEAYREWLDTMSRMGWTPPEAAYDEEIKGRDDDGSI